jgi:hypothetical protein
MTHRAAIKSVFKDQAFIRPLFYGYPGGLRFELSEGGHAIDQFLTAHRKASEICSDVFPAEGNLTVCLRAYFFGQSKYSYRATLRELACAGIDIPASRSLWVEQEPSCDRIVDGTTDHSVFVAFSVPATFLPRLLWCALCSDFGSIHPHPQCTVYLFSIDTGVMALPYDDRGMDIVGPNAQALAKLYRKHKAYLLKYDIAAMQSTFEPSVVGELNTH